MADAPERGPGLAGQRHRSQPFLDNLFAELCQRLRQEGLPLTRATMHLRTLHPQFQGARVLWRVDHAGA